MLYKIALAQINPKVGDFENNLKKIKQYIEKASEAHIIVFPELALVGYPPQDWLLRKEFLHKTKEALKELIEFSKNFQSIIVVGYPSYDEEGRVYNTAGIIYQGKCLAEYRKHHLPNYGVFDEYRYFQRGEELLILKHGKVKIGFLICEDAWYADLTQFYAQEGIHILLILNASPYEIEKFEKKLEFIPARSTDGQFFTAYVNLVGAQDSLVFDGRSFVVSPKGRILTIAKDFEEDLKIVPLDLSEVLRERLKEPRNKFLKEISKRYHQMPIKEVFLPLEENKIQRKISEVKEEEKIKEEKFSENYEVYRCKYLKEQNRQCPKWEEVFKALVLGIRDYFKKQGFKKAVIGLSGGIDSALVCVLATAALGKENVLTIYLPTKFNSNESYEDAKKLAENLEVEFKVIEIEEIFQQYENLFKSLFPKWKFDVADENIQARIRANILFYYSNKEGYIVLSTSNKSESAVGYTTIYGDMAGGLAPIKDLYKTWVYELARWYNQYMGKEVIPRRILEKPPSAELREGQKDQDTLPPYPILDKILQLYIEEGFSIEDIIRSTGYEKELVLKVIKMLHRAEYKRKQAPLGIKVTRTSFDLDWRMPIVKSF
jgi:NAD+ synthase (glutamine-hydrolysing)